MSPCFPVGSKWDEYLMSWLIFISPYPMHKELLFLFLLSAHFSLYKYEIQMNNAETYFMEVIELWEHAFLLQSLMVLNFMFRFVFLLLSYLVPPLSLWISELICRWINAVLSPRLIPDLDMTLILKYKWDFYKNLDTFSLCKDLLYPVHIQSFSRLT